MAFDFGNVGDLLSYGAVPQHTEKATNLSPHVDGGTSSAKGSNTSASADARRILHTSIAIVLIALVLLWALGGIAFRSATL